MRLNDDEKTVAAMDVLAPKIGEIIGGSQRKNGLEVLERRIQSQGLNPEDFGGGIWICVAMALSPRWLWPRV